MNDYIVRDDLRKLFERRVTECVQIDDDFEATFMLPGEIAQLVDEVFEEIDRAGFKLVRT